MKGQVRPMAIQKEENRFLDVLLYKPRIEYVCDILEERAAAHPASETAQLPNLLETEMKL